MSLEMVHAELVRREPHRAADVLSGPRTKAEGHAARSRWDAGSHQVVAHFGAPALAAALSLALSAEGRSVLALAEEECLAAGHMEVAPLDLLVAAVRYGRCRAAEALGRAGVSEGLLRAVVGPARVGEHSRELVLSDQAEAAVVGPGSARSGASRDTAAMLAQLLASPAVEAWQAVEKCGASPKAVPAALGARVADRSRAGQLRRPLRGARGPRPRRRRRRGWLDQSRGGPTCTPLSVSQRGPSRF